jgi:hypothetical protein
MIMTHALEALEASGAGGHLKRLNVPRQETNKQGYDEAHL